jgi:hypothetical protein
MSQILHARSTRPAIFVYDVVMADIDVDDQITVLDGFKAMRVFLHHFWERGHFAGEDLRSLLSWTSLRSWRQVEGQEPFTGDPAQWPDWKNAVREALAGLDPDDLSEDEPIRQPT